MGRRLTILVLTFAIGLALALIPMASQAATPKEALTYDTTIKVGHFDGAGNRVVDKVTTVPDGANPGASGSGVMPVASRRGKFSRGLDRAYQGASISSSGSGGWPSAFGCGFVQESRSANDFVTGHAVVRTVVSTDWCWGYGVRVIGPTGGCCPHVVSYPQVLDTLWSYDKPIYRLSNFYSWNGWPRGGDYNKAQYQFTGVCLAWFCNHASPWVHLYVHGNGTFYWTSGGT
jgi:hypothetical protein